MALQLTRHPQFLRRETPSLDRCPPSRSGSSSCTTRSRRRSSRCSSRSVGATLRIGRTSATASRSLTAAAAGRGAAGRGTDGVAVLAGPSRARAESARDRRMGRDRRSPSSYRARARERRRRRAVREGERDSAGSDVRQSRRLRVKERERERERERDAMRRHEATSPDDENLSALGLNFGEDNTHDIFLHFDPRGDDRFEFVSRDRPARASSRERRAFSPPSPTNAVASRADPCPTRTLPPRPRRPARRPRARSRWPLSASWPPPLRGGRGPRSCSTDTGRRTADADDDGGCAKWLIDHGVTRIISLVREASILKVRRREGNQPQGARASERTAAPRAAAPRGPVGSNAPPFFPPRATASPCRRTTRALSLDNPPGRPQNRAPLCSERAPSPPVSPPRHPFAVPSRRLGLARSLSFGNPLPIYRRPTARSLLLLLPGLRDPRTTSRSFCAVPRPISFVLFRGARHPRAPRVRAVRARSSSPRSSRRTTRRARSTRLRRTKS